MIELLVAHFQDAGYTVRVFERALRISKIVDGEELIVYWGILQQDLQQAYKGALIGHADRYIYNLKKCEEEKRKAA